MNIKKNTVIKMLAAVLSTSLLLSSCGAGAAESNTIDASLGYDGINVQAVTYGVQSNDNNKSNDKIIKKSTESATAHVETKRKETEKNSSKEYKSTIEPPEDGWTHEQISEVMYLCGKPFSLPCKLEDLPEDFEIGKVRYRDKDTDILDGYITVNGQDIGFYDAQMLLNGESIGLVYYYEDGTEKKVFGISIHQDLYERDILVINGINQNSLLLEVRQALGCSINQDPYISSIYSYYVTDSKYPEEHVRFLSFDDDEGLTELGYGLYEMRRDN